MVRGALKKGKQTQKVRACFLAPHGLAEVRSQDQRLQFGKRDPTSLLLTYSSSLDTTQAPVSWLYSGFSMSLCPLRFHRLRWYLLSPPSHCTSHHFWLLSLKPSFLNFPDPPKSRCVSLTPGPHDSPLSTSDSPLSITHNFLIYICVVEQRHAWWWLWFGC